MIVMKQRTKDAFTHTTSPSQNAEESNVSNEQLVLMTCAQTKAPPFRLTRHVLNRAQFCLHWERTKPLVSRDIQFHDGTSKRETHNKN